MALKLFAVNWVGETHWDAYDGFVVAAKDELHALEVAHKEAGKTYMNWMDANNVRVERIGSAKAKTKPSVVFESWNNG